MIFVVIRPFKSGGKFYPAGEIIDPAGFKLLKSRLGAGNLKKVDEHNIKDVAHYLQVRHKIDNAEELLVEAMTAHKDSLANNESDEEADKAPKYDEEYLAKVYSLAEQLDVEVGDRDIEDVVAEIKEKAAKVKENEAK